MYTFYMNGDFVPMDQASVPATDLSVIRGYGVFDFFRTYKGGKPFHLEAHLQRLAQSANLIGLDFPWTQAELKAIVMETLARNDQPEYNVRLVVTGGLSADFITPNGNPRLMVMVTGHHRNPDWWYQDGAKIVSVPIARNFPTAKSINYIPAIMARKKAKEQGAIEALYVGMDGQALECTTANFFAFVGDKLVTPQEGVLEGVTRSVVMALLADSEYELEVRDIQLDELKQADEVFLSASNKEIVPIIQIDDSRIGKGQPGERTRHIMEIYQEATRNF